MQFSDLVISIAMPFFSVRVLPMAYIKRRFWMAALATCAFFCACVLLFNERDFPILEAIGRGLLIGAIAIVLGLTVVHLQMRQQGGRD